MALRGGLGATTRCGMGGADGAMGAIVTPGANGASVAARGSPQVEECDGGGDALRCLPALRCERLRVLVSGARKNS